jgi:RNA polymerase sigma factor (TIGR02999 family)
LSFVTDVALILRKMAQGDPAADGQLLTLVYDELRRLAAAKMSHEAPGQTLQPTALVHEAWLRLGMEAQSHWQTRNHFLAAAAEAMRRILVETARRKLRLKRGGGRERVDLEESAIAAPAEDEKLLLVHEALDVLAAEDPQKAQIVKLRFFGGLGHDEIAALLGVNEKTIRRHWEVAKVRLFQNIKAAQQIT